MQKRKLKVVVLIGIIVIVIILVAVIIGIVFKRSDNSDKAGNNKPYQKEDIKEVVKNNTELSQKGINISDLTINDSGSRIIVTGSVSSSEVRERVTLELLLYNGDKLAGTTSTVIELSENSNFELSIVGDYSNLDSYKVVVVE